MNLWQSTPELIAADRQRLNRWMTHRYQTVVQAMAAAGVPAQLIDRRMGDFPEDMGQLYGVRTMLDQLVTTQNEVCIPDGKRGLVLAGKATTGKSSIAAAWLRKTLVMGETARFVTIEEFSKFHTSWIELSSNGQRYGDEYVARADEWREENWRLHCVYEHLVIDDIGRSQVPAFVLDELHEVVRKRAATEGCFTILTSNKTMSGLQDYVGLAFGAFLHREFMLVGLTEVLDMGALRGGE